MQRIRYFDENDLTQEIANIIGAYRENAFSGAKGNADAQLFKRNAFEHESEVRLIYVDMAEEHISNERIEISVDPNQLIEEITLDPRILAGQQEMWRTNWLREHGFQNEINRSLIYLGAMLVVQLYTQEDLAKITKLSDQ